MLKNVILMIKTIEVTVKHLLKLPAYPKESESSGGYFTILDRESGQLLLSIQIGKVSLSKARQTFKSSLKKALRLHSSPDCLSSWQNKENEGAITAGNYILSFDGLENWANEAAAVKTAFTCGLITGNQATEIIQMSNNPFYRPLTYY